MSSSTFPRGVIESFACGHAVAPGISNQVVTQQFLANYLANAGVDFEPLQIFTMGPCPLSICHARAGDGYDHTVEQAYYGLAEASHYDALYGAIQFCYNRFLTVSKRLDALSDMTIQTVQYLCLPEIYNHIHFKDDIDDSNDGQQVEYDLEPTLGRQGFAQMGVLITRMEHAIKNNEPKVLFLACATQAEALLERMCGKMTGLEALVEKMERVQAVLIASSLNHEKDWTEEDERNLENGNIPHKCNDNIQREKIAMRIFRPDVTCWSQVIVPNLTMLLQPDTMVRSITTPPWRKEPSPVWPWTASLDRLFSVRRERWAPESVLISPRDPTTDEEAMSGMQERARYHHPGHCHMGLIAEAANTTGARDFDTFEF